VSGSAVNIAVSVDSIVNQPRHRPLIQFKITGCVIIMRDTIVEDSNNQFLLKSKKRKYKKPLSTKGDVITATPTHRAN
jgi:hypothetical protein